MGEVDRVTQKRASGFWSLPSTSVGKWSARLLLLTFVLMLLQVFVVMPVTEQRTGLELLGTVFTWVLVICLVSAGISGLFALFMRHERSWAVVLSAFVAIVVMGAEVVDSVIPG